jgi:hypothetical protein
MKETKPQRPRKPAQPIKVAGRYIVPKNKDNALEGLKTLSNGKLNDSNHAKNL